jgi:hypothetical protein
MKKLLSFFTILMLLFSCREDDFGGNAQKTVSYSVNVKYDASFNSTVSKNAIITLTNSNTGDIYTQNSNDNGVANFTAILPGTYKISVNKKMAAEEFNTLFGYTPPTAEVIFNGAAENITVNSTTNNTSIELKTSRIGDLVIKQIYYSGSNTSQGASFRDQFIEIYNNSNEVVYADGLYIGQLYGKSNNTVANYTQSNGQFDWSKSLGMTLGDKANTDYVYADYVFRIPGNGTQYPIKPGESIVIAQSALNHKSPLMNNDGEPINIQNPDLTIDLSKSDFEAYLGDFRKSYGETVYLYDIQNPAVQDLEIAYWGRPGYYSGNRDFLMDNLGRDSFVIFRSNDFATYPDYADSSISVVTNATKFFKQIPSSLIIDGVDLQHFNPSSQRPKMLQASIDATSTNCDASFNSQSVIRKVKTTLPDGRRVLEDTNSSAQDFVKLAKANPKGFAQ